MKKWKSKILKSGGEQIDVSPKGETFTLAEMQEIVGGNIQMIFLRNNMVMIVNEEGRINNLGLNVNASLLMRGVSDDFIVGNVLLTNRKFLN